MHSEATVLGRGTGRETPPRTPARTHLLLSPRRLLRVRMQAPCQNALHEKSGNWVSVQTPPGFTYRPLVNHTWTAAPA